MALVVFLLIRSERKYKQKMAQEGNGNVFQLMMRTRDPELVWDMLQRQVSNTQSHVCRFALEQFNAIIDGFQNEQIKELRHTNRELRSESDILKKYRRQEMLGLKRCPPETAIERNTWFHLGANCSQQFIYSLRRMLDPIREHIGNSFNPVPQEFINEFEPIQLKINELMKQSETLISTRRFENYRSVLTDADQVKDELSVLRKRHLDRMQNAQGNSDFQVSVVYLNLLQETQQFLNAMRHQLRAAKKFTE